jgi:hypothetical protein
MTANFPAILAKDCLKFMEGKTFILWPFSDSLPFRITDIRDPRPAEGVHRSWGAAARTRAGMPSTNGNFAG